jgi:RNase P/RNase MRP subunit p29
MKSMLEHVDTSDYPADNMQLGKKVLGKMKVEVAGVEMEEFVGLRAKVYAFRVGSKDKKAKGIKKCVVDRECTLIITKNACSVNELYKRMNLIRSYAHDIYSVETNKLALSYDDDKRQLQDDGIPTLPLNRRISRFS